MARLLLASHLHPCCGLKGRPSKSPGELGFIQMALLSGAVTPHPPQPPLNKQDCCVCVHCLCCHVLQL